MKTSRLRSLCLSLMACLTTPAWADLDTSTLSQRIEQDGYHADVQDLVTLRALLEAEAKQLQPDKYLYYYLGYVDYALAYQYDGADSSKATACVNAAEDALTAALKADPDSAEVEALLGTSYGLEIALHPMKGMWLGPKAHEHIDRAVHLAPGNPRVLLLNAMSDFNTPAMFGGDKQHALWGFHAALTAFDSYQASDAAAPGWGKAWAYEQLGVAEQDVGQAASARADYGKALELVPNYKLAQRHFDKLPPVATATAPARSSSI